MSMAKENRKRSPHRIGRGNHTYIINSRKTMEIVEKGHCWQTTVRNSEEDLPFYWREGAFYANDKKEGRRWVYSAGFWLHCSIIMLDLMILVCHFQLRIFNDPSVTQYVHPTSSCWCRKLQYTSCCPQTMEMLRYAQTSQMTFYVQKIHLSLWYSQHNLACEVNLGVCWL